MNVLDSLKEFFMPADEAEQETVNTAPPETERVRETPVGSSSAGSSGYSRPVQPSYEDARSNDRYATIKTNVQFQVVLVKATTYTGDSKKVADYLIQGKTVVLNLESINDEDKRRIIDFVVGAAYAMHGRIRPIANQTFLIIPKNVGFDGGDPGLVNELQENGLV